MTALRPKAHRPGLAAGLAALAALCFASMSALLKTAMAGGAPLSHAVFFRAGVNALLALAAIALLRVPVRGLPVRALLVRSLLGGVAMVCGFYAIRHLPLGDAEVLRRSAPVFVVVLAWPFLGERPTRRMVLLVLVALAGTVLVVKPTLRVDVLPGVAGLLAGGLGAGAYLYLRHLAGRTPVLMMVAFFTTLTALAAAPFALAAGLPRAGSLAPLLGAGVAGTLAQVFMTNAYRYAPAAVVATVGYLAVAFSTGFGVVLFEHVPGPGSLGGAGLIVLASVLLARERARAGPGGLGAETPPTRECGPPGA